MLKTYLSIPPFDTEQTFIMLTQILRIILFESTFTFYSGRSSRWVLRRHQVYNQNQKITVEALPPQLLFRIMEIAAEIEDGIENEPVELW